MVIVHREECYQLQHKHDGSWWTVKTYSTLEKIKKSDIAKAKKEGNGAETRIVKAVETYEKVVIKGDSNENKS